MADSDEHAAPHATMTSVFAEELALVFDNMTGEKPSCRQLAPQRLPGDGRVLAWKQEFSVATLDTAWLVLDRGAAAALGSRMLSAAGIEERDEATATSTCLEILSQALSAFSRALGVRAGREVACAKGEELAPPADLDFIPLEIQFPDGLNTTLFAHFAERPMAEMPEPAKPKAIAGPVNESAAGLQNSKTLDLLLDVELPVSVSFGKAQMPLKDVVKLTTGSIIELNRTLSEPVELIVNNCVIARGEVVVVEGNFGIRIQHVVSRQDRLRSVF